MAFDRKAYMKKYLATYQRTAKATQRIRDERKANADGIYQQRIEKPRLEVAIPEIDPPLLTYIIRAANEECGHHGPVRHLMKDGVVLSPEK